jgi:PAS domain S-box-containing protein
MEYIIVGFIFVLAAMAYVLVYLFHTQQKLKQKERALNKSEQTLQTIVTSAADMIYLKDYSKRYIYVNPAICKVYNLAASEIIGKRIEDFVEDPHRIEWVNRIDDYVLAGNVFRGEEMARIHSEFYHNHGVRVPLYNEQGEVWGLCGVIRDISDIKQTEDQLRQSLQEKEILLREVHHRVKNNLNVICSLLNLQLLENDIPCCNDILKTSLRRIHTMAYIHNFLYQVQNFTRVDFKAAIWEILAHLQNTLIIDSKQIEIKVAVDEMDLDLNQAIPCGLIITELVSNALKHGFPHGKKGTIYISMELDMIEQLFALRITDDGIGFSSSAVLTECIGFGMNLTRSLVHQIKGEWTYRTQGGVSHTIVFPKNIHQIVSKHTADLR